MSIFSNIVILVLVKMLAFINLFFVSEMMAVDMSVVTDVCIWGRKSWKPTEHNKEVVVSCFLPIHLIPG